MSDIIIKPNGISVGDGTFKSWNWILEQNLAKYTSVDDNSVIPVTEEINSVDELMNLVESLRDFADDLETEVRKRKVQITPNKLLSFSEFIRGQY